MRRGRQPSMLWGQLYPAHANLQHETRLCDQWGGKCVAIIYRITRPLDPTIHLAFAILCARLERMGDWGWRASPYCRNHSFHLSPSTLNLLWADTEAHLSLKQGFAHKRGHLVGPICLSFVIYQTADFNLLRKWILFNYKIKARWHLFGNSFYTCTQI